MDEQQQQQYHAIKALVDSGADLKFALEHHHINEQQWQNWVDEQSKVPSLDSVEYQYALETINTTAQTVRNLMLTFISVLTFIIIMVLSTNDKVLFLNSTIMMPLLNIGLPADKFFFIAPLLILFLHANLVFNLYVLVHKAGAFKFVDADYFFPFILLQSGKRSKLTNAVKNIGMFLLAMLSFIPFYVLIWITHHLAIYQDHWLTILHKVTVFAEFTFFFFVLFLMARTEYKQAKKKQEIKIKRRLFQSHLVGFVGFVAILTSALTVPIADECDSVLNKQYNPGEVCKNTAAVSESLPGTSSKLNFSFPSGSDFSHSKPIPIWQYNNALGDLNELDEPLQEQALEQYISRFTKGVDLSERNLRFLSCPECNLQRADLRQADLSGAFLVQSDLSWSDLTKGKLVGANLSLAKLDNVTLTGATIIGGLFFQSSFNKVDLSNARFERVYFQNSQFISQSKTIFYLRMYNSAFKRHDRYVPEPTYSSEFIGGMHRVEFCDLNAEGLLITGRVADEISGHHNYLRVHFSNLSSGLIGNTVLNSVSLQFVDFSDTQFEEVYLSGANRFNELNVTGALFKNSKLNQSGAFADAMCLRLDEEGAAIPPKTELLGISNTIERKRWPLCRPWLKKPIPCGDEQKMKALIAITQQQPVQYCHINNAGVCVVKK